MTGPRRRREALHERLFRSLLSTYPGAFRDEYGREIAMVFADRYRCAGTPGRRALVWLEAVIGILKEAPREHAHLLQQDCRYALRTFRRTPWFTATVVLTLALGFGASTTIFSLVSGILLQPLPYADTGNIVTVAESAHANDVAARNFVAPANFLDWRSRAKGFAAMGAYSTFSYNLSVPGPPQQVTGAAMSQSVFNILGVQPLRGRVFRQEDDRPAATAVVLVSARLWHGRFQSAPGIVGQPISVNGTPHVVIGVMPDAFDFPETNVDLWIPLERQVTPTNMLWRGSHYLSVIARLGEGTTIDQARAEMNRIAADLKREHPKFMGGGGAAILPLRDDLVRGVRRELLILFAAAGLLLLIACANVANLFLSRAKQRDHEMALRTALGAGRSRIVRQLVVESTLLSACGGVLGVGLAIVTKDVLLAFVPQELPRTGSIRIDITVLLFTAAISVLTALVFALVPAVSLHKASASETLRGAGRWVGCTGRGRRGRAALAIGELALALVLLVGAGLLVQTFARLQEVDTGFQANDLLTARISLPRAKYASSADIARFYDGVLQTARDLPGIEGAAVVSHLPLTGHQFDNSFSIEGRPSRDGKAEFALVRAASADYFRLLGITILRGRAFEASDRSTSAPVAVVNEAMARHYWSGVDPIGKRLTVDLGDSPMREIVGIVRDVRTEISRVAEPMIYLPYTQQPFRSMTLAVRTKSTDDATAQVLQTAIQGVDPDQPMYEVRTLRMLMAGTVARWHFSMVLLTTFAGLALTLAAVGLFGVMSRLVTERTAEIGLRVSLGARPADVLWLVSRYAARLVATGLAIGCVGAFAATPVLASLLFHTTPTDAASFLTAVVLLTAVAACATILPTLRAARLDPLVALRQ